MHKIWQNSWDGSNTGNFILRMLFYISWLAQFLSINCKHWGFRRGPTFCASVSAFIPPRPRRLEDLKHLWLKISKTKVSKAYLFLEETCILVLEKRFKFTLVFGCSDVFFHKHNTQIMFFFEKANPGFYTDNTQRPAEAIGEYFSRWLTDGWLVVEPRHIYKVSDDPFNKAFYRIVTHQTATKKPLVVDKVVPKLACLKDNSLSKPLFSGSMQYSNRTCTWVNSEVGSWWWANHLIFHWLLCRLCYWCFLFAFPWSIGWNQQQQLLSQ